MLLQQAVIESILAGVAGKRNVFFAGVAVAYWQQHRSYIKTLALHGYYFIAEGIFAKRLYYHFKRAGVLVFNNKPGFGKHDAKIEELRLDLGLEVIDL